MGGPAVALAGGALIGLGASLLLLMNGRLGAVGGIVGGLLRPAPGDAAWRVAFVLGLVVAGLLFSGLLPSAFTPGPASMPVLLVAGVAVGFGARLGGGCTSGHGVCGISRFSSRSLVATATFMSTGAAIVALVRLMGGAR